MKRSFLLNLPYYLGPPPEFLWSRGWYGHVDHAGDCSIFYRARNTERRVRSLSNLVGRQGVIWLRLNSTPIRKGRPADLITFADKVVGRLGGPTVLVTTDGDMSIPTGLPVESYEKILNDPDIKAWFSQNIDLSIAHPKLKPLPVGLDLHTGDNGKPTRPATKANTFSRALEDSLPQSSRKNRIWSDVHFKSYPNLHQDIRGQLKRAIDSGLLHETLVAPKQRLSQREVWKRYGSYRFVMSLPGHAIEAHRTWEALALGAIVITISTSLDRLLEPFRVVFLDKGNGPWWSDLNDSRYLSEIGEIASKKERLDLSWGYWKKIVREPLT